MTSDRPAPGPLPPLARADVRRDRRPGGGRRDAAQRRPDGPGLATRSCSSGRAARARRRWRGSSPRRSTARTSRTATPATPARRASRSARARRWTWSRSTPRATAASTRSATCASGCPTPRPSSAQGLHPRRGPPDHEGRLERAPEVARGAARLRRLHVRLDRAVGVPAGDPVAPPALRRPTPDRRPRSRASSRRILEADGRTAEPAALSPHRPARRRRHARRRVDARPAAVRRVRGASTRRRVRDLLGLADAEAVDAFIDALVGRRRARRASRSSTGSRSAAATSRALLDQVVDAIRGRRRRSRPSLPARATPRPGLAAAGATPRRDRPGPGRASAACASSSSSRCSRRRGRPRRRPSPPPAAAAGIDRDHRSPAASPQPAEAAVAEPRRDAEPPRAGCHSRPRRPAASSPHRARRDAARRSATTADGARPASRPPRPRPPPATPAPADGTAPPAAPPRPPARPPPPAAGPDSLPRSTRRPVDRSELAIACATAGRRSSPAQCPARRPSRYRRVPAGRRRGQRRDPRLPGGPGVPQGRSPSAGGRCSRTAIGAVLGRAVSVRCVATNLELVPRAGRRRPSCCRGAADLRRRPRRRRRGRLTGAPIATPAADPDHSARLTPTTPRRSEPMGMANLQRMAQQMQQEMLRIQAELEATTSTARPAAASSRAGDRQAGARQRHDRPVRGRPVRRRDAPGPRRRRRQRRAPSLARSSPSRRWPP